MSAKRICFVISPIGDPGSEIRKRADQILHHLIEPVCNTCGYDPQRADKIAEPGLITSQVIQHLLEAPLVVADLTGTNPNVFYELAIRHTIRKPLIQIISKGERIPFDVAGMRTVQVDHQDLDSVEEARSEIEKQIKSVEDKKPEEIESPITVSLQLQALRQSDKPEQRSLAEFVSALTELRSDIAALDKRLSDPSKLFPAELLRDLSDRANSRKRVADQLIQDITMISHELLNIKNTPIQTALKELLMKLVYMLNELKQVYR